MRTKTLLLAVAALAVSLVSSQAQVYSGVAGYINVTVGAHQFAMIANQLDTGLGSNTLNNVLTSGPVSSSTTFLLWTGTTFRKFDYYNSGDSPDGNTGWYDDITQLLSTNSFNLGAGGFVQNPSGSPITLTTVGNVVQGTNVFPIQGGFHIYSIPDPLSGTAIDTLNFPAVSSSDTMLQWIPALGKYKKFDYYNSGDSPDGNTGWYDDVSQILVSTNAASWPNAGGSFFIQHSGATEQWTNVFNVQ